MSEKPCPQRVGVQGINAYKPMQALPSEFLPPLPVHEVLQALAEDHLFRDFIRVLTGLDVAITRVETIEAVFKIAGVGNWSDLSKPVPLRRFADICGAWVGQGGRMPF